MTHLNETLYCCGIACSAEGAPTESGNYMIDLLLANVCKQNVTRFPYEIVRLAEDIAGGLMVTAPGEADFRDEKLGARHRQVPQGRVHRLHREPPAHSAPHRATSCPGTAAVGYRTESMHGAGSPQAQRIMILRQGNLAPQERAGQGHRPHQGVSKNHIPIASVFDRRAAAIRRPPALQKEASAMYEDIEAVLDEHVRPLLRTHGGEMEIIEVEDGVVRFKLKGKCAGCPAADLTTEELIQTALTEHLPHIKRAVLVQDISPELLDEARSILKMRHGG